MGLNQKRRGFLSGTIGSLFLPLSANAQSNISLNWKRDQSKWPGGFDSVAYPNSRVLAILSNAANLEFSKPEVKRVTEVAATLQRLGYDGLVSIFPGQGVPRSYSVNQTLGSPSSGRRIFSRGPYPWILSSLSDPWVIQDPISGLRFPTNDFSSYLKSGLNSAGAFDPKRADPRFLANVRYPEKGPNWGVDDGLGWIDSSGNRWLFVAYWHHWAVWYGKNSLVMNGLDSLVKAYVLTGDERLARAGLMTLMRIALVYGEMNVEAWESANGFLNAHGGTGRGKAVGRIWECDVAEMMITAFDVFSSALEHLGEGFKTGLLESAGLYRKPFGIRTNSDLREYLRIRIVQVATEGVLSGQIRGNFGMHHKVLVHGAALAKHSAERDRLLRISFEGSKPRELRQRIVGINNYLINSVSPDGFGDEGAPGYNQIWVERLSSINELTNAPSIDAKYRLNTNPRFSAMLRNQGALLVDGKFYPSIGDSGRFAKPGLVPKPEVVHQGFATIGSDELLSLLQIWSKTNRWRYESALLFSRQNVLEFRRTKQSFSKTIAQVYSSRVLPDFGFAVLTVGPPDSKLHVTVNFSSGRHSHRDRLGIGLYGFGLDLSPDLGYPERATRNKRRIEWTSNTIAHNCVVVDGKPQKSTSDGQVRDFADFGDAALVSVDATGAYEDTTEYRRTVFLVGEGRGSEPGYVVDFFIVAGGNRHLHSFHAASSRHNNISPILSKKAHETAGHLFVGPAGAPYDAESGLYWLRNARRVGGRHTRTIVSWPVRDYWGVGASKEQIWLSSTSLTQVDTAAVADGSPPQNQPGNPKSIQYLLLARHATDEKPLRSEFVSVLIPSEGRLSQVVAEKVETNSDATVVRVKRSSEQTDYIIVNTRSSKPVRFQEVVFDGAYGILSLDRRLGWRLKHLDCREISVAGAVLSFQVSKPGRIVDFQQVLSIENWIEIEFESDPHQIIEPPEPGLFHVERNNGEQKALINKRTIKINSRRFRILLGDYSLIASSGSASGGKSYFVGIGEAVRFRKVAETAWQA